MENLAAIHETLYLYLIDEHRKNPDFRFTTRITNRYGRLTDGYWFHGNDHYLTISFWAGMDWKNKTPNIQFVATADECYLGISTTDSDDKQTFVDQHIRGAIKGLLGKVKYYKWIADIETGNAEEYLTLLKRFILEDKHIIDRIMQEQESQLEEEENGLGFIDPGLFSKWTDNVERYREAQWKQQISRKIDLILDDPTTITSVKINAFSSLNIACEMPDISKHNRCIFITGENGVGKTSILRAIGTALTGDHARAGDDAYDVTISLNKPPTEILFKKDLAGKAAQARIEGYAAYGPYRIVSEDPARMPAKSSFTPVDTLQEANAPLYHQGAVLYDLDTGLAEWRRQELDEEVLKLRLDSITGMISDVIPGFKGIKWGGKKTDSESFEETTYRMSDDLDEDVVEEEDIIQAGRQDVYESSGHTQDLPASKLATGAKSVLAMLSDMMVRLFRQQPQVQDVAALKGIVLIDEIDIHLHPKFQKQLTRQLVSTFPKIQFIISTHSPIPLLGAPDESVFFRIRRNEEKAICAERIEGLDIKALTPNALLTSPVFGMGNILHRDWQQSRAGRVRVEDDYDDIIAQDQRLNSLIRKYNIRKQA